MSGETWANGFGTWHALATDRGRAHRAICYQIAMRDQRTGETLSDAYRRIRHAVKVTRAPWHDRDGLKAWAERA